MTGFGSNFFPIILFFSFYFLGASGNNHKLFASLGKVKEFWGAKAGPKEGGDDPNPHEETRSEYVERRFIDNFSEMNTISKNGFLHRIQSMFMRNYGRLSASQRLATTPVYYICNTRGSAFIQDDVQVRYSLRCKSIIYFYTYIRVEISIRK